MMKRDNTDPPSEQRCDAIGDVIARAMPSVGVDIDTELASRLQRALTGSRPPARRRWLLAPAVVAATATVFAAVVALRARPLAYEVSGATAVANGRVDAAAGQVARLQFSEGTSIALEGPAVGRVKTRTRAGATFALEGGHATFAVVHRPDTHWTIEAGPFQIEVTGTRFGVRWSEERGALELDLHEGSVTVRGAIAGAGVPLRAGQRLVAVPARGVLRVEAVGGGGSGAAERATGPAPAGPTAPPPIDGNPPPAAPAAAAAAATDHHPRRRVALRDPQAAHGTDRAQPGAAADAPAPEPPAEEPLPLATTNRESLLNGGGDLCNSFSPQFRFEKSTEGFMVPNRYVMAVKNRALDHTHSWCGTGSLRMDVEFNTFGPRNKFGTLPYQAGQVTVPLGKPVDLTDKLVVVHFYLDAPAGTQFGVQVFAINQGRWVGGGVEGNVVAGRWWTISHVFQDVNSMYQGGTSAVNQVDALAFQIYATGDQRTWSGTVYVDDVGWR